ncbi:MAG TPA: hypothetical protein VHZ74_25200 [Bryobacteraceae bacterium]|nr:hypothetical protein [Bryobacteraceae bacterium]
MKFRMVKSSMLLIVAASMLAAAASDAARVSYAKSFPGSNPAWLEVVVDKSGAGQYKEDPKDDDPIKFQLSGADATQIFALADKLDHFSRPLESGLKVANMGMKTFRYEGDGRTGETKFNYSEDVDARALTDWFERIAETERSYLELERSVRFDKLGAQQAILRIEIIRDQKRLVAPDQFLPLLDRVVKNESFLHIARDRAAGLAEWIRALPK